MWRARTHHTVAVSKAETELNTLTSFSKKRKEKKQEKNIVFNINTRGKNNKLWIKVQKVQTESWQKD